MSDAPETRTSFGRARRGTGQERKSLDLGKPRYLHLDEDGLTTWLWCARCGARRAGNGAGFAGGWLHLLHPDAQPGELLPRIVAVIPCDCELGKIRRRAALANGADPIPGLDRFKPSRLRGPHFVRTGEIAGPFAGEDPPADHDAGKTLELADQSELDF